MENITADKRDAALNFAFAAAKGVAGLAIMLEKHVGIEGAAGTIHKIMLDALQEVAEQDRPGEAHILAKMFGPNFPPRK